MTIGILIIIVLLVAWLITTKKESLLPPWDLEKCRARCYAQGQQLSWNGGPKGPWDDPANYPSSNFDVAGCMTNCDLETWNNE